MTRVLIGGIDSSGPHLFSIDPFGSIVEEKYVATGSGSPVAYGILEEKFKEDLAIEETLSIVARALRSAMKRDVGTGDSLDIVIIDKNGYRELSAEEKSKILKDL